MTVPVVDDPWPRLLGTATLVPSPHNVQPWRIRRLDHARAQLYIERRRTLPNEDVTGSFIILTMGMLAEGLSLVAAHDGLALDVFDVQGAFDPEVGPDRWDRFRTFLRQSMEGELDLPRRVEELRARADSGRSASPSRRTPASAAGL